MQRLFSCAVLLAAGLGAQPPDFLQPTPPPAVPPGYEIRTGVLAGGSYLGVNLAEIDSTRAKELKLKETTGVEITRVEEGSPAEKAGLKPNDVVLESPRAGALFRICDPKIAAALVMLSTPQQLKKFRRQDGFPGGELLALLVDCGILFKVDAAGDGLRATEGDDNLVMWDFHDLLFHTHSTAGRQANPLGGLYPYAGLISPPPAVRPRWPGKKIDLRKLETEPSQTISPVAKLLRERHSTRSFDDRQPITLTELSQFLDRTARIQSKWKGRIDLGGGGPVVAYAARPYPSGGSAYELELYLAVANCAGLARGFYHYDADRHALVRISGPTPELDAQLAASEFAMDAPAIPQILITIAARFGRISWKYSSIAYALILKDVGVLTQTLYLMATDMGLGGCAIGSIDIDLFARMTGIEFHIEGPVGQFALGRGSPDQTHNE